MAYVDVDDIQLHVQDVGSGDAVVLVAGFGLDHRVWDRQVRVLGQAHRVICLDQRGHGLSDKPFDGYSIERLAHDLLAVLEHLRLDSCVLVGWSFGGQVAFRAAAIRPELVRRLVLVGSNGVRASHSAHFPFGADPDKLEQRMIAAEHADRITARRTAIAAGFAQPPDEMLLDWLVRCSLDMPSWAAMACHHTMLHADLTDDIPRVTMPVLQLIGRNDPVHSAAGARWLGQRLADSQVVELADCGHYPIFEAPDAFDDELLRFLS